MSDALSAQRPMMREQQERPTYLEGGRKGDSTSFEDEESNFFLHLPSNRHFASVRKPCCSRGMWIDIHIWMCAHTPAREKGEGLRQAFL